MPQSGTTVGTAYVQIIPSAEGIKQKITDELSGAASSAGSTAGGISMDAFKESFSIIGQAVGWAVDIGKKIGNAMAQPISAALQETITGFADYEQSLGGIEALFGGDENYISRVVEKGKTAWKDLNQSTSDYYSSFTMAYSLIRGSSESTDEAINTTNKLLTLESDLANTYGYDMTQAATAINWALKGSYNYLDNLGVGFQGTKENFLEMANASGLFNEELQSADDLTSEERIAVISHYAEQYGVLGRTASESAETIQGSSKSMQSAFSDLWTAIGSGDNLEGAFASMEEAVINYASNLGKLLLNVLESIPDILEQVTEDGGLLDQIIEFINTIDWERVTDAIVTAFEAIIDSGAIEKIVEIINLLAEKLKPAWEEGFPLYCEIMSQIAGAIGEVILSLLWIEVERSFSSLWESVKSLFSEMFNTAIEKIQSIWESIKALFGSMFETAASSVKTGISNIWNSISSLFSGMFNAAVSWIRNAFSSIVNTISNVVSGLWNKLVNIGSSLINGIKQGVMNAVEGLKNAVSNVLSGVLDTVKGIFGIHSPSTVFRDEIGQYIPLGIAEGITNGAGAINSALEDVTGNSINASITSMVTGTSDISSTSSGGLTGMNKMLSNVYALLETYLPEAGTVYLDREKVSRGLSDTMTKYQNKTTTLKAKMAGVM